MSIFDFAAIFSAVNIRIAMAKILSNIDAVNKDLADRLSSATVATIIRQGNIVVSGFVTNGNRYLVISEGAFKDNVRLQTIKLGNTAKLINKRVINDLQVWQHREYHGLLEKFDDMLDRKISDINIRGDLDRIGFNDRLFCNTVVIKPISELFDLARLVDLEVLASRTIFNKATVTISVTPARPEGDFTSASIMETISPIHDGIMRQATTHYKREPVNQYVQEVVRQYFNQYK